MIDMWLYKINLADYGKNNTGPLIRDPKKKVLLRWFDVHDEMYISHISFIT